MKVSRRGVFQGGVLAASGAVLADPLRAWAQLEGSRIPTGGAHPVRPYKTPRHPLRTANG